MRGMIFAAGLGTRLGELVAERPKALVEVGGKPMIQRVMERMAEAGIEEVVVNVHHHADVMRRWLERSPVAGIRIHVSDESGLLLDTGGGLLKARRWLEGGPFLVHNADIVTDLELGPMIEAHLRSGADATLLCAEREGSRKLLFDGEMRMTGWRNLSTGETRPAGASGVRQLSFGGIHVLSPAIFGSLEAYGAKAGEVFSITPFYVDACRRLKIQGYEPETPYTWIDAGRPDTLARARQLFG